MGKMDDFLKPESMMTPGVAGAITMTISNTMWVQFGVQQRWSALVLSFAFGALVFTATRLKIWQRSIYYVLNSLIIFSAAAGSNYIGYQVSETAQTASLLEPPAVHAMSWPTLAKEVDAAESSSPIILIDDRTGRRGGSKPAATKEDIERLKKEAEEKEAELERLREELAKREPRDDSGKMGKHDSEKEPARPPQQQRSFFTPSGF